ncbi:MAG TPA: hypothetical protein VGB91_12290 [Rhizomicrobium sp.]
MQGLANICSGGNCTFTPQHSGKVQITIFGTIVAASGATAGDGIIHEIYYGTGTAPTNGASIAGTLCTPFSGGSGAAQESTLEATPASVANVNRSFSLSCTASLTVGTTYWTDLAAKSVATVSHIGLANVGWSIIEN